MSIGGIIAGALGGAAKGYTDYAGSELKKQQEVDLRTQLMAAEEEKMLRIDDIRRSRDRTEEARKLSPEYLQTVGAAELTKGEIAAKNRTTLAPSNAAATGAELEAGAGNVKREMEIKAGGTAAGQIALTNTPGYLGSLSKEAGAKESSAGKATAAAANFDLAQKRAMADLRTSLSGATDPQERELLTQQIQDLSGGSTKSYADMVTAGDAFRKLANNLRQQIADDLSLSPADRADLGRRASLYEEQAAAVLGSTVDKRLGGGAGTPRPGAAAPAGPSGPWNQFKPGAGATPGAASPSAAPTASPTSALPTSLSPSVDDRVAARKVQTDREASKKATQAAEKKAWNDELRSQAAGLTPARIGVLEPSEALDMISKYGSVLSPAQRRELNRRL